MDTPLKQQADCDIKINEELYSWRKCIGSGGFGKVYEVSDKSRNLMALKVVNMEDTLDDYKNEIELLNHLQFSDRIIKMYDYEYKEEIQELYILMEKGGINLEEMLRLKKLDGKLTDERIMIYWEEMLQAVSVLHKEGIVHCDLKPANFVFVADHLKLIDFGMAKAIPPEHSVVIVDQEVGTIEFVSPEAVFMDIEGGNINDSSYLGPRLEIGVKSDIWSLGCILYYMVYGVTPLYQIPDNFHKVLELLMEEYEIPFPSIEDKSLINVLQSCLSWNSKDRPSIEVLLSHPYLKRKNKGPIATLSGECRQS